MARDPGSTWKPLAEAGAPDGHTKTQFIVHSTGTLGSAAANWNYFQRGDVVVESTFIVGLTPADPTLQIMDSTDHADANGSANRRGISVEVVGDGVGPYTDWQIRELVRLGRWAAATHPIERRVIPSEAASGFGWHVMFGAPGPWTSVRGKVCPGGRRTQQLKDTVFPAIFAGTNPAAQEDDMFTDDDRKALDWLVDAVNGEKYRHDNRISMLADNLKATAGTTVLGRLQAQLAVVATASNPAAFAEAVKPLLADVARSAVAEAKDAGDAADADEIAARVVARIGASLTGNP